MPKACLKVLSWLFSAGLVWAKPLLQQALLKTFAICNTYIGEENTLYHFDMYRVDGWDDLYSTGFFDFLETDAYMAIEWSENVYGALPDDTLMIEIERIGENDRLFKMYKKSEEEE